MSNERAYVNCQRCHYLYQRILRTGSINLPGDVAEQDDKVYEARNEAMKALEDEMKSPVFVKSESSKERKVNASKTLVKCMDCDFSAPKICIEIDGEGTI